MAEEKNGRGRPRESTEGLTPKQIKRREYMRDYMRENWKKYETPETKARDQQYQAEYRQRPEVRERIQLQEKKRVGTRNEYFKELRAKKKAAEEAELQEKEAQ